MESPNPNPLPAIPGEGTKPITPALAIRLARRGVWSARLARVGLLCLGIAGFLLARGDTLPAGMGLLFGTVAAWVVLVGRTARNQQDLMRVPAWLEAGDFGRVDATAARVLGRFSVSVQPRLAALRHLAFSRHGRKQFADAQQLAMAALAYNPPKPVGDGLRLLIAEAALAANDLAAAHAALSAVVAPLPLRESLKVLQLQTDYCVRVGAWPHVAHDLPAKVELAELLPAETAAVVQAMFALAAKQLNQPAWAAWLSRRAALLAEPAVLVRRHPVLGTLFPNAV